MAGSKQERIREVGQGRAFCARRASGRSEAESLDKPHAPYNHAGKNGREPVLILATIPLRLR